MVYKLIYRPSFDRGISEIYDFIAKDSEDRARSFISELLTKIELACDMPLSCRKNPQLAREDVRDVIYKGYVVPFLIKGENIFILDIYKNNEWKGI